MSRPNRVEKVCTYVPFTIRIDHGHGAPMATTFAKFALEVAMWRIWLFFCALAL